MTDQKRCKNGQVIFRNTVFYTPLNSLEMIWNKKCGLKVISGAREIDGRFDISEEFEGSLVEALYRKGRICGSLSAEVCS